MLDKPTKIHVSVSDALEGEVLLALNRVGGVITEVSRKGEHSTGIGATVPSKNVPPFTAWLTEFSKGHGHVSEDPE
jgi:translation elongation factor EF-G